MVSKIAFFVLSIVGHESVEDILLIDFLDSPAAAGVLTVRLGFVEKVLALLHGHARTLCLVWIPDRRTGNCCLYLVGRIRQILHDLCHQDGWHGGLVLDLSLKSPGLLRDNLVLRL